MSKRSVGRLVVILILAVPAWGAEPGESTTGFIDVPGGKLWYEAKGEGTPIVFLHDGLLPSATWDGQFDVFARSFRAIRYDRRGFGRSEAPKEAYSDLDDLHAVLAALKVERAILVGCSSGAQRSVDYALEHPDHVEALVLVGPVVSGLPYSAHFRRRNMAVLRPWAWERSQEKVAAAWAADPYLTDSRNTKARERLRELLAEHPPAMPESAAPSLEPKRPANGRLGEIRMPTLIVVGASDIPDVHAHAGALEAGIRGARRVILPDAGHLVQLEKPEELNREIFAFLRPAEVAREYLRTLPPLDLEKAGHLFDYDASAPLDVQEKGTETRGDVRILDLSFASPKGGRVPAFLILPPGEGRRPAVLFLHPARGDRSTFIDEAVELANRGIVSLSISAPLARPEFQEATRKMPPFDPEASRAEQIQTIVDVRRGFDFLASRAEVDPKRLAVVGHSFGAMVAGPLMVVDRRPLAYVLMAGLAAFPYSLTHGYNRGAVAFQTLLTPEQQRAFVEAVTPFDSVHYIGRAAPAKLFFQFATHDVQINPLDVEIYVQAASEPKEVKWYDTGHFFNEEARRDRVEWVVQTIGNPSK